MNIKLTLLILSVSFLSQSQIQTEKGKIYRWTRVYNDEMNSSFFQSLSEAERNNDFLGMIYRGVEDKNISIYFDTVAIGNFGKWLKIPEQKYYLNPKSPEISYTFFNLDYLKVLEESIKPKKNSNGDSLFFLNTDGTKSYQFEYTKRQLIAKDTYYVELLEVGKYNRRKDTIDFSLLAIGLYLPYNKSTVWLDYSQLNQKIGTSDDFIFLKEVENKNYHGFQYRQEGFNPGIMDIDPFIRRIKIEKNKESQSLYTEEFFNPISSLVNSGKMDIFLNYRKEPWDYRWEQKNFDIPLVDTIAFKKRKFGNYQLLARKGPVAINKYGDTLFQSDAFGNQTLTYESDIFIHFKLKDLKEVRIHEKAIRTPNYPAIFEPESIVFVIERKGIERELFLLDIKQIKKYEELFKNEEWYQYLIFAKYPGQQYYQSR